MVMVVMMTRTLPHRGVFGCPVIMKYLTYLRYLSRPLTWITYQVRYLVLDLRCGVIGKCVSATCSLLDEVWCLVDLWC
jgi:hypothetical protein